jgi:hypothetical protein
MKLTDDELAWLQTAKDAERISPFAGFWLDDSREAQSCLSAGLVERRGPYGVVLTDIGRAACEGGEQ